LTIAAAAVITTMTTIPVMAANSAADQSKSAQIRPAQIRHTATIRHQHARLPAERANEAVTPRSNVNARNANASAGTPVKDESMASQLGRTVTSPGTASDPVCKPGTQTALGDGKMHPCQ